MAMVKEGEKLSATAYLLSQEVLLQGIWDGAFSPEDEEAILIWRLSAVPGVREKNRSSLINTRASISAWHEAKN